MTVTSSGVLLSEELAHLFTVKRVVNEFRVARVFIDFSVTGLRERPALYYDRFTFIAAADIVGCTKKAWDGTQEIRYSSLEEALKMFPRGVQEEIRKNYMMLLNRIVT